MEEGITLEASREGASEIGLAVMATTLSIVAVFVPVAFMKGIVGKFFFEFGITVTIAVLISLFVSLTLTPMMTSRFLSYRKKHGKVYMFLEKGFDKVFDLYNPLLALALREPLEVIALAAFKCCRRAGFLRYSGQGIHARRGPGEIHGEA
jgi:HAE1 family hydrophobic/amphiphilic exporter-1